MPMTALAGTVHSWFIAFKHRASPPLVPLRCLPIFGNVIPRPNYSPTPVRTNFHADLFSSRRIIQAQKSYIKRLFYFIGSYSAVLAANYTFVFCCMAVTYYKVFRRIRGMIHTHGNITKNDLCSICKSLQRGMRTLHCMELPRP